MGIKIILTILRLMWRSNAILYMMTHVELTSAIQINYYNCISY